MEFNIFIITLLTIYGGFGNEEPVKMCPHIRSRKDWEAMPPKLVYYQVFPVSRVIVKSTNTKSCSDQPECDRIMQKLQKIQMKKHHPDIPYNFLITDIGTIYEGVGWHRQGSHTAENSTNSIGVGFLGKHDSEPPKAVALKQFVKLLQCGVSEGKMNSNYKIHGHRQFVKNSKNPGDKLYQYIQIFPNWAEVS